MMMNVRVILVCALLLLAAVPSFANANCRVCDSYTNRCVFSGDATQSCKYDLSTGSCYIDPFAHCFPTRTATVASEWKVVSIEISRPALDSITVTAPAATARTEEPAPETAGQK